MEITAADLKAGDRVRDNFTDWAMVTSARTVSIKDFGNRVTRVLVSWTMADGTTEHEQYDTSAKFELIDRRPVTR